MELGVAMFHRPLKSASPAKAGYKANAENPTTTRIRYAFVRFIDETPLPLSVPFRGPRRPAIRLSDYARASFIYWTHFLTSIVASSVPLYSYSISQGIGHLFFFTS